MRSLVYCWSCLPYASHWMTTSWSCLPYASHWMTTSWSCLPYASHWMTTSCLQHSWCCLVTWIEVMTVIIKFCSSLASSNPLQNATEFLINYLLKRQFLKIVPLSDAQMSYVHIMAHTCTTFVLGGSLHTKFLCGYSWHIMHFIIQHINKSRATFSDCTNVHYTLRVAVMISAISSVILVQTRKSEFIKNKFSGHNTLVPSTVDMSMSMSVCVCLCTPWREWLRPCWCANKDVLCYSGSCLCYVQGRLLQSAVGRITKVSYRQVAAGHECCSASCERHEEVRPRLDTPASLW